MPLHVKSADVPERKGVRTGAEGQGSMVSVKGYGNECSLMIASRAPGYHTTPHIHESEQLNYIQEGEIWFFVEESRFSLQEGRLPENPGEQSPLGLESIRQGRRRHRSPRAWAGRLKGRQRRRGSFDAGETPQVRKPGINEFVSFDAAAVENKYFGKS